ncbi:DUF2630 family protein [Rhodococcus rhodnii]|uniref:DUF2630 family protein n=1 Tax=Rhodococcus rhodnii TaxID=38312 RepID=A0A6P2CIB9_9NOCA|nr:DUF2630 family protein [Rhodococcus rhodnii]TXG92529.1 DUF2630 family protein [Rhodococcus rhodnii]
MNHEQILAQIQTLVGEEHELRTGVQQGTVSPDEERERLKKVEAALDQCWDLLRRRDALKRAGQDPDSAQARSESEVEGYLQ